MPDHAMPMLIENWAWLALVACSRVNPTLRRADPADPAADAAALGAAKRKRVQLEGGLEYEHGDDGGGLQVRSPQPGFCVD